MRPSELPLPPLEVKLAQRGIADHDLVADGEDVPELRAEIARALGMEAKLRIAVRHFWDEGHPQPTERTEWEWTGRTPDWDPFPAWRDDGQVVASSIRPASRVGRRPGSYVEPETFWAVWEMALDIELSIRAISAVTENRRDLAFINRDKVAVIARKVRGNKPAARAALAGRRIPPSFSATPDGIELPLSRRA